MIHIITNYNDCNNEISTVHKGAIHSERLRRRENQECLNLIDDFGYTVEPQYLRRGYLKLSPT